MFIGCMCHFHLSGSLDKLPIWRKSLPGSHKILPFPKREVGSGRDREKRGERREGERENGLTMSPKRRLEYLP